MTILKDAPGIISPYDGIIFIQATVIKISFRREGEIRMMYCLKNGLIRFAGIILMVLIGILQTVGIMITAISAVVLKSISTVMLFATVLLLVFGLFTWERTLVVAVICASMFWLPEGMSLIVLALGVLQGKVMDMVDTLAYR